MKPTITECKRINIIIGITPKSDMCQRIILNIAPAETWKY